MDAIQERHAGGRPCPFCMSERAEFKPDDLLQEKTNAAKILCPYKHEGCHWMGEIRHLSKHLRADCVYAIQDCPYLCGVRTERESIQRHLEICKVFNTPLQCQKCSQAYPRNSSHQDECPEVTLHCPYRCGAQLKRGEIASHLKLCPMLRIKPRKDHTDQVHHDWTSNEETTLLMTAKKLLQARSRLPEIRIEILKARISVTEIKVQKGKGQSEGDELEKELGAKVSQLEDEEERAEQEVTELGNELHLIHNSQREAAALAT